MDSKEIVIWTDRRWYQALSTRLAEKGTTIEDELRQHFEVMLNQLPAEQYEQISREIWEEDQRAREEWEASRQFAAFHVREQDREEYFRLESSMDFLDAAHELRLYLRKEHDAPSFAEGFRSRQQITAEEFDQLTATHLENPRRVTGVFDLDFDKQEFSTVDLKEGWRTFGMKDVSTAVYHAYRENGRSRHYRQAVLEEKLVGKELASAGHLCARQIMFSEEISEMDGRLNFYMDAGFDADAMFGTNVCTGENDDCLNVYAEYDMASGQVCDELEVDLHRADGGEESVPYHLNAAEKAVLLRKMDTYCQEQTGMTLKDYSAQLMAEDMAPPAGPSM